MVSKFSLDQINKIRSIIEERDRLILEKEVRIKFYKEATEKKLEEKKKLERTLKEIEAEDKIVTQQLAQVELIEQCLKESNEVTMTAIGHYKKFEKLMFKDIKEKENQERDTRKELNDIYLKAKNRLGEDALYKKLQEAKVERLRLEIEQRMLEAKIARDKKVISERNKIKKQIFYNTFVQLAENYVIEQKQKELEALKLEESNAIKQLYIAQEKYKKRQKQGIAKEKSGRMTNISFDTQDFHIGKQETKPERTQIKEKPVFFNESLTNMFQQDESQEVNIPNKIKIISQRTIVPSFQANSFEVPEKRKKKSMDMSLKWQKMMKTASKENVRSEISSSQQSERFSECSQRSQLSQIDQNIQQSQPANTKPEQFEAPGILKNSMSSILVKAMDGKCQSVMENTQFQSVNMKNDQFQTPNLLPIVTHSTQEKVSQLQAQIGENVECQNIMEGSQACSPSYQEFPTPSPGIMKISKAKRVMNEPSKSVRFDLDPAIPQNESQNPFGGASIFGNTFSSFFNRAPMQTDAFMQDQEDGAQSSMLNMSLGQSMQINSPVGLDFKPDENEDHFKSPELSSYEMEENGDTTQMFKTPEMPSFGGDMGFFSFGPKKM